MASHAPRAVPARPPRFHGSGRGGQRGRRL